jgi:pSer/pThr/pTyr-binding forkhead associated (FHA) protein
VDDPRDRDKTARGRNDAPPAPTHTPFGGADDRLYHTIPELAAMPVPEQGRGHRVVRLVSMNQETDLTIELQDGVNKVGRQRSGNHIVLVSGEISRFHAEVEITASSIVVRDLGSSNGTFVNGVRVEGEQPAHAGDEIGFSTQFLFQLLIEMITEPPEVVTIGVPHEMPELPPDPPSAPEAVPSSLEDRRRQLEQAPPPRRRITAERFGGTSQRPPPPPPSVSSDPMASTGPGLPPMPALPRRPTDPPRVALPPPRVPGAVPISSLPAKTTPPVLPTPSASSFRFAGDEAGNKLMQPMSAAESAERDTATDGTPEVNVLERERRQLAVLYQVSKRCMSAENLAELDRLLISVLERIVSFDRGFITYQLPSGDWKLVMSPKGDRWDRAVVRSLLQAALRLKVPLAIPSSASDDRLGSAGPGRSDSRLLLPLRSRSAPVGAIFLISSRADSFDDPTVDFLALFADIAALAVVNCARLEGGRG